MADYLDDWVEPENSTNRVWLRNGKMHIIPYDEPGRLKDGSITLNNALQYLSSLSSSKSSSSSSSTTPRSSECNKSIQKILYSHTIHNYPARIFALHHNIIVILPEWIALLFQQYPQYLAKAIYYFHNYNNDKIKDILKLSLFNTMLNRITTTAAKASSNGTTNTTTNTTTPIRSAADHEQHIIALSLPLTRLLYAQLNFKNFKIPRKYHNLMRRISLSSSRKVMKAFDLGCRLSCGLECMYYDSIQQDRKRNNHASNSSSSSSPPLSSLPSLSEEGCLDDDKTWISLVSALQSLHYLQHPSSDNNINNNNDDVIIHKLKQLYLQSNIILTSLNEGKAEDKNNEVIGRKEDSFCVVLENFCAKLLPFTDCTSTISTAAAVKTTTTASMYGNIVYSNGNDKNADKLLFDSISKDRLVGDDDSWLYLTPDELDKELQDRMDRYTNNHHHDHHHDDNVDSHHNHQQHHNEHKIYQHQHDQEQQQQQQQQSNDNNDDEENTSNSIETNKIEDTHDNGGEAAVKSNDQVDTNQLDSIIEGLKSFMSTKSDYDGVTSSIPIPSASLTSSLKSSTPSIRLSNIEEKQPFKKKMVAFNEMATTTTTTSTTSTTATANRNINDDYRDSIYVKVDTPSNITTGSVGSSSSSSNSSSSSRSSSCCKSSTLGLKIDYDYLNRLMKDMVLNNDSIDKVYVLGDDKKDNTGVDYKNYNNIININDSCTADDGRSINHIAGDGDDEDDDDIDDGIDQHDNSAGDSRVDAVVDDGNNMKDFLTYFSNDDLREFDGDSINDSDDSDDDKDFNDDNDGDVDVDVDVKDYGFNPHFNSKHHQLHTYDNLTGSIKTSHLNDASDASYVGKGNFIITTTNEMESNKSKYVNHIDGNDVDDDDDDIDSDDEEENDDSVVGDDVKVIKHFQVCILFAKYMHKSSSSFTSMYQNKYKHHHNHNHHHRNHHYYCHL